MIAERITDEELDLAEVMYYPVALAECLFSQKHLKNDDLATFNEDFAEIRLSQFAMMSYEYLLDDDPHFTEKENAALKKGSGEVWSVGARKYGKTLITEKVDLCICLMLSETEKIGFTSYDMSHIRGVLEDIIRALEEHPILKVLNAHINRSPNYRITLKNGTTVESVNMNLAGKNPGGQWFQKHFSRIYIEECSFETDQVYKKRIEAVAEDGVVIRAAGMTNFRKHSPIGRIYTNELNKPRISNYPQYVSPKWDDKQKKEAILEHGGEQSATYRVFVKGEVIEDGVSVIDMERVRKHYLENKEIKRFEITKENFEIFDGILFLEKPRSALNTYVCADIGESAPTEIVVLFEFPGMDATRYRYTYNITLYNLTDEQQFKVFQFIGEVLGANFIGIDTTDGTGRAIFRRLEGVFPRDNLAWVHFAEKLPVDFEKDEQGNVVIDNDGKPVQRMEYVSEWSIKNLKTLLYFPRIEMPLDHKLDIQLNSLISMQSSSRTIYQCVAEEDHLLQGFQVFSITQWMNEFKNARPLSAKKFAKLGSYTSSLAPTNEIIHEAL